MLDRDLWRTTIKDALHKQALNRTPEAVLKRIQVSSTRAPRSNLKPYTDLLRSGQAARGRSLQKAAAARLCPTCNTKCVIHCLQCGKPLAEHRSPAIPCQLCFLHWSPCCPQPAQPTPRLEDITTPAPADNAFLCNLCYGICRLYPMPPEERLRHCCPK